jgi:hypothetical protein
MTSATKQGQPGPAAETVPKDRALPSTQAEAHPKRDKRPKEIGGPSGPEPTRYGDWERAGRCVDF